MNKQERQLRQAMIDKCRWMNAAGLNQGTSGNISARFEDRMLITPSATPYDDTTADMIASMPIEGEYGHWEGMLKPSTEWRFHLDIMKARPEVGAIVHIHATFATVLAIARRNIPACHYMIAAFGGNDVRCADYATYGTKELSVNALAAMEGRTACLLANHGLIATGPSLDKAMWAAVELETIAKQYYYSLAGLAGHPERRSDRRHAERVCHLWPARDAESGPPGARHAQIGTESLTPAYNAEASGYARAVQRERTRIVLLSRMRKSEEASSIFPPFRTYSYRAGYTIVPPRRPTRIGTPTHAA